MASLLRQIVAGPRARHPEAGLDLCYVTDNIIATSGPSQTYPQRAYRNPLDRLVEFLNSKHDKNWAIWEFRAEGTGYPDELVYNRIRHYPWPDHHPPPFRLVPMIIASMRNWLNGNDLDADNVGTHGEKKNLVGKVLDTWKDKKDKKGGRVVVVHCKAGKGRSGTMACSYLIAECGWTPEQALARFTERRMRPKFGAGVTIPSQLRWIGYVDRWTKGGKKYVDRELEIIEIHVWGLRSGVKLSVEGYVDGGKKIKIFHTFSKKERVIVEGNAPGDPGVLDMIYDMAGYGINSTTDQEALDEAKRTDEVNNNESAVTPPKQTSQLPTSKLKRKPVPKLISSPPQRSSTESLHSTRSMPENSPQSKPTIPTSSSSSTSKNDAEVEPGGMAVIFKPHKPIKLPSSDVNICIERRNRTPAAMGFTMVTAVAHVWFNTFFEGNGPEQDGNPDLDGVFDIDWDKLDGIKGSSQKGTRAADRIAVVWRSVVSEGEAKESVMPMPSINTPVPQMPAADWKGGNNEDPYNERHLGLRVQSPDSADVSQASSIKDEAAGDVKSKNEETQEDIVATQSDIKGEDDGNLGTTSDGGKQSGDEQLAAYMDKLPKPEGGGK
ncbi:Phosphatidylinositol 3,4,5-trisphosphate 3-phosphatase and dual-specificity protein phosphatase PTEN [Daldinia childiae]|uniref:Phosphatidylinositol 3,4,5-trisphosphate 3-phosphatase and dual-specificity protein phosphatase PTEN n=1 Tax=Daldinia childiae TaxID=326645 RepID=UPI0014472862|nr:Phosphatidylinositol 3,4,5-trisphosphate 3-phosphatase and dual-specificity protein phosphatase PTEN [Daldinia childiae]KAF3061806.1 Phosphatidylinositol 3,4,5-trisphosphate 3-phosphatase and dual-specificity protein phosphatase PTEN [Daldinia childiae]